MKFSVTLVTGGDGRDPAALAGLAALAESAGWDAFFLEDYLCYRGLPTYDPWVCLAAIAAATTRIRLGTTVTPLPRRQPWELAAQAVAIDHLSGGRLILGAGSGAADDPAFTATGTPISAAEGAARLDEGLQILTSLWTGTPVRYHGRYYHLDGLHLPATPVQQPRIPIWIGGDLRRPGVRRRLTGWDGACVYRDRALDPPTSATSPACSAPPAATRPDTTSRSAATPACSPNSPPPEPPGGDSGSRPATPTKPGQSSLPGLPHSAKGARVVPTARHHPARLF